jgi:hypothetical protein
MILRAFLPLLLVAAGAAAEEHFVVGAAQKQGQEGSWWSTEVWISNTTATTAGYASVFLPAGQGNPEGLRADPALEDLPPGMTVMRRDLVPEGGLGTLRIITTQGVVVFARVYNSAGRGSFGLGLPALQRPAAARVGEIAHLVGLRRTPQFRSNMGIFNPTLENGRIHVRLVGERGELIGEQSYGAAPGAFVQLTDVVHSFGIARGDNLRIEVTGTVPFFAYATVVDSRSGAPTLILPLR